MKKNIETEISRIMAADVDLKVAYQLPPDAEIQFAGAPILALNPATNNLTVPSRFLPRLTPPMPDEYVQRLSSISYQWATCMVLTLDRQLSPFYWLTVCDPEVPFVAVVEQTNLIEPSRYGGNHVVYLSNYVSEGAPILSKSVDEVFDEYVREFTRTGYTGGLNWYRNFDRNWATTPELAAVLPHGFEPMPADAAHALRDTMRHDGASRDVKRSE